MSLLKSKPLRSLEQGTLKALSAKAKATTTPLASPRTKSGPEASIEKKAGYHTMVGASPASSSRPSIQREPKKTHSAASKPKYVSSSRHAPASPFESAPWSITSTLQIPAESLNLRYSQQENRDQIKVKDFWI